MLVLSGDGPLYEQVTQALRTEILEGSFECGGRLPSTRSLAVELGVSRNVALIAFEQLAAEGYLESRLGSGSYVAASLPDEGPEARPAAGETLRPVAPVLSAWGRRALALRTVVPPQDRPVEIDFRYGFAPPDADLFKVWRRTVARSLPTAGLDYAPPEGDARLRVELAKHLRRRRGVACEPEQIVVVSGSQQALDLATRVLVEPKDLVIIEDPHYQGARAVFGAAGARLMALPVGTEGIDPSSAMPEPGEAVTRARLAYVTPSHQFPTGVVMSISRRLALLDWAERHDAFVLEDDYDSEFRYEGRPIQCVQSLDHRGRTLYVGTFSKVLFPALRLGFLVLPSSLVDVFRASKWLADRHSPQLEQAALADFLGSGAYDRHVRRMRRRHAARREALIEAITEHLGDQVEVMGTEAGIHLVVWLERVARDDLANLLERAAEDGVGLHSIGPYYSSPPRRAGLLLGYGALEPEQIREGVVRLSRRL